MKKIDVKTLNSVFHIEEDDSGRRKVTSIDTSDRRRIHYIIEEQDPLDDPRSYCFYCGSGPGYACLPDCENYENYRGNDNEVIS